MSIFSRLFGAKPKESQASPASVFAPNTKFVNSMQPHNKADTDMVLLELRLREDQRIEIIQKLYRDSSRTLATSLSPKQTLGLLKEKHARIWIMIVSLWGSAELHRKFRDLLFLDSSGRAGFSFDVLAVLMRLHEIHVAQFGEFPGAQDVKTKRGLAGADLNPGARRASVSMPKAPERDRW